MITRLTILTVLFFSLCCSLYRFSARTANLKILGLFLAASLFSELVAFFFVLKFNNNLPVFHVLSPLLFLILICYFNRISITIKRYHLGMILGVIGVLVSLVNTWWLQPINTFNSNYLLFQGLCICLMGFIALHDFEEDEVNLYLHRKPDFWVCIVFLSQQIGMYCTYILIHALEMSGAENDSITFVYSLHFILSIIGYLAVGIIFLLFPAKNQLQ